MKNKTLLKQYLISFLITVSVLGSVTLILYSVPEEVATWIIKGFFILLWLVFLSIGVRYAIYD